VEVEEEKRKWRSPNNLLCTWQRRKDGEEEKEDFKGFLRNLGPRISEKNPAAKGGRCSKRRRRQKKEEKGVTQLA